MVVIDKRANDEIGNDDNDDDDDDLEMKLTTWVMQGETT